MKYLLGVDIGTTGTKTILVDTYGIEIASSSVEYPLLQPQNGWAEQMPLDWWNATVKTCKDVFFKSGVDPHDVAGIGLTGQMHGLVMLDEFGEVLRDSIIWCDQRTGKECEQINDAVGPERLLEITANPAITGFTASKILWVRNNEPHIYAKCRKILLPKDYVRYKLTGEFATDVSDASGTQLLDIKHRSWSEEVLEKLDIDIKLLPRVYESYEITGKVTHDAAELTGLAEGTIVVGGAGDNAAAAVGTGVVFDNKAFTTIGTSGVVFAHTSQMKIDPRGRVHTFCSAVPGEWHVMGVTQAAGLSLQWFKNNFCGDEVRQAIELSVDPYELMDSEADRIPIGANKLIYLPYLMGERTPYLDPDCRGVFFGLSASHRRPDLIRAVMEGVAFSLYDSISIFKEMGINFPEMLVGGGGGMSKVWRSMLADVFDSKIKTLNSSESPAFGSAILASVGTGVYSSLPEACSVLVNENRSIEPNHAHHEKYMKSYEVYKHLYGHLSTEFKALAAL